MRRARVFAGLLLAVTVVLAAPHAAAARAAAKPPTRYSLVHGCYMLRSGASVVGGADGPYRMQAAALGQYLIYGAHHDFLGSNLAPVSTPAARPCGGSTGPRGMVSP